MFAWIVATALALTPHVAEPFFSPTAATHPLPPIIADAPIETPAQVMALPPELRARMDAAMVGAQSPHERYERLLSLLFDPDGLRLTYQDEATHTVSQAYATRTANCLTFAMMFIALAREAGLDAKPQVLRDTLAWRQDNQAFYRVDHVNTIVRIGANTYLVDILSDSVIKTHAPIVVSDQLLIASYYNNLAMQDLEHGRLAPAMREMQAALDLDADYATYWSNAGVLYLRNGNQAAAQHAYEKAIALEPENVGALANMANLARMQGDLAREEKLRKRLDDVEKADPFFHFLQAEVDLQAGDYPHAIERFRIAIHLYAHEPRFYAALANAYVLSGDKRSAIGALNRAKWLSTGSTREDYRRQADALRAN